MVNEAATFPSYSSGFPDLRIPNDSYIKYAAALITADTIRYIIKLTALCSIIRPKTAEENAMLSIAIKAEFLPLSVLLIIHFPATIRISEHIIIPCFRTVPEIRYAAMLPTRTAAEHTGGAAAAAAQFTEAAHESAVEYESSAESNAVPAADNIPPHCLSFSSIISFNICHTCHYYLLLLQYSI